MISTIDMKSGAGIATPPAACVCSADQVVLMAPYAAPSQGTGLPFAGTRTPIRPRGLAAAGTSVSTPGAFLDITVPTTALREFAVVGVPAGRTSSTPGDLPPEDPLS